MVRKSDEKVAMTAPGLVGTALVPAARVDEFTRNGWSKVAESKPRRGKASGDGEK